MKLFGLTQLSYAGRDEGTAHPQHHLFNFLCSPLNIKDAIGLLVDNMDKNVRLSKVYATFFIHVELKMRNERKVSIEVG